MVACSGVGAGAGYIGRRVNPKTSDQTNLKEQRRCNLGSGGGTDIKAEHDRLGQVASYPLLQWLGFWCPLEPSRIVSTADKRNFI